MHAYMYGCIYINGTIKHKTLVGENFGRVVIVKIGGEKFGS